MFTVGNYVKYMEPLDHDFRYGIIREAGKGAALIEVISYPFNGTGKMVRVGYRYLYKVRRECIGGICENN